MPRSGNYAPMRKFAKENTFIWSYNKYIAPLSNNYLKFCAVFLKNWKNVIPTNPSKLWLAELKILAIFSVRLRVCVCAMFSLFNLQTLWFMCGVCSVAQKVCRSPISYSYSRNKQKFPPGTTINGDSLTRDQYAVKPSNDCRTARRRERGRQKLTTSTVC